MLQIKSQIVEMNDNFNEYLKLRTTVRITKGII